MIVTSVIPELSPTTQRNQHLRGQQFHFGDLPDVLVGISSALGMFLPGDTLHSVLVDVDERLNLLELGIDRVGASFTADAFIVATVSASLSVDAILLATIQASLTADAIVMPVFTVDAEIVSATTFTFVVDAFVLGWFTVDAFIGDVEVTESTLGDMSLGDATLGDT